MNRIERSRALAQTALARSERTVVGAAVRRFIDDGMNERAASLGFYALFSLIPVVLIAASALRLFGDADTIKALTDAAGDAGASSSVTDVLRDLLDKAFEAAPESAGSLGIAGLVTLLYGASKVFTDAGRAMDQIHGAGRVGRPLVKRVMDFGWTVGLVGCGLCWQPWSSSPAAWSATCSTRSASTRGAAGSGRWAAGRSPRYSRWSASRW